jgi:hypothetical protein
MSYLETTPGLADDTDVLSHRITAFPRLASVKSILPAQSSRVATLPPKATKTRTAAKQREVTRCTPIRNFKSQFRQTHGTFHSPSKSADAATRCFYAIVARRAATRARSPLSTERTAWMSARHPMTFRGRWQRSPRRRERACLIDLRLLPI